MPALRQRALATLALVLFSAFPGAARLQASLWAAEEAEASLGAAEGADGAAHAASRQAGLRSSARALPDVEEALFGAPPQLGSSGSLVQDLLDLVGLAPKAPAVAKAVELAGGPEAVEVPELGLPAEQHLTVCNAYMSTQALTIFKGLGDMLVQDPLPYSACRTFAWRMPRGQELEFQVGNETVGAFAAKSLPAESSQLLLIPYRSAPLAKNAAFRSHIFAQGRLGATGGHDLRLAQVAVIDTYTGAAPGQMQILRSADNGTRAAAGEAQREAPLSFGGIAFLNPGSYTLQLFGHNRTNPQQASLVAREGGFYVALRVGSEEGGNFPEDLVLFDGAPAPPPSAPAASPPPPAPARGP